MSVKPVWFIPRTRDRPPAAAINLGDIIASPENPEQPINGDPPPQVPTDRLRWITEDNWSWSKEFARSRSGGIFASFLSLSGIGGDIEVTATSGHKELYDAGILATVYFAPTSAYIKQCLEDEDVKDALTGPNRKKRVFMITGLKTAYGATKALEIMKKRGVHGQLGVDLTALGAPISLGPKGGYSTSTTEKNSGNVSDFVFGFKLSVLSYKKGQVEQESYTKGALYGEQTTVGGEETEGEETEQDVDLDDWDVHDASAADFGLPHIQVVEDEEGDIDVVTV